MVRPALIPIAMLGCFVAGLAVQGYNMRADWSHGWDTGYKDGWANGSNYIVSLASHEMAEKLDAQREMMQKPIRRLTGKPVNLCAFAKLECRYNGR